MEPTAEHSVAGQRIGKYELISRLARGGMAELFVARVTGLEGFQKVVALKRILPHLAGDAEFVEMFLAEARLAAALEHPNIVPVFDFGKAGNDYFFAMPYIHGKDLLAILRASQKKRVRLPLAQAVGIVVGISAGLHYTHDRVGYDGEALGIVHRDISPANVLVTFDGHIKVADFGIAKAAAQTSVTKVGVRKGKAAYMSPEQVRGHPVDRRSDIFSVGIVLWELLTMRRLFRGDDDLAIMHCIVSAPAPPPSSAVTGIPPVLDAIVAKCLEPDVQLRYQTAKALVQDLQAFATAHGLTVAAGPLADYLETLFGRPDPPWTSAPAMPVLAREAGSSSAGPAATSGLVAGGGFAQGGTAHTHRTEEVTRSEALDRALHRAKPSRGALFGAGLGTLLGSVWWAASSPTAPEPPPTTVTTIASPQTPEPLKASVDHDLRDLLNLVNQPDWGLALEYGRRHTVLDRVVVDNVLAAAVDTRLNVALDLLQAMQSPAPCETYDTALSSIEARPDAYYVQALRAAKAPAGTTGCSGNLSGRRASLLERLTSSARTTLTPGLSGPPTTANRDGTQRRRRPAKPAAEQPSKPRSESGLRPFGQ